MAKKGLRRGYQDGSTGWNILGLILTGIQVRSSRYADAERRGSRCCRASSKSGEGFSTRELARRTETPPLSPSVPEGARKPKPPP